MDKNILENKMTEYFSALYKGRDRAETLIAYQATGELTQIFTPEDVLEEIGATNFEKALDLDLIVGTIIKTYKRLGLKFA